MTRDEIIAKVKAQNFPVGSYVVYGSAPMAAAGIRPTHDIDLVVSPTLYTLLQHQGWRFKDDPHGNPMLALGDFEASKTWVFGSYNPSFEELLESADVIEDVPFVNLHEVRKWKQEFGRAKDLDDVKLIDEYLKVQ